jgi:hypothetical protein
MGLGRFHQRLDIVAGQAGGGRVRRRRVGNRRAIRAVQQRNRPGAEGGDEGAGSVPPAACGAPPDAANGLRIVTPSMTWPSCMPSEYMTEHFASAAAATISAS